MRFVPRLRAFSAALLLGPALAAPPAAGADAPAGPALLAKAPPGTPLPVHALLRGGNGELYALVFAPAAALSRAPAARALASASRPSEFVVGLERRPGARSRAAALAEVLLDDGRHVVARAGDAEAEALAEAGLDLYRLPAAPFSAPAAPATPFAAVTWSSDVAAMAGEVTEAGFRGTVGSLCGQFPLPLSDGAVWISTRHTRSGADIERATRYAFERLTAAGLATSYHPWANGSTTGRNVAADLPGTGRPSEIVVLCAHLDDMPSGSVAPGADDDASGSAAVLLAAEALAGHRFRRTIRFVLFTGEEQGLLGSAAYAEALAAAGANVVAVLNLDMIGWNGGGPPTLRLHTRSATHAAYPADRAVADAFRAAASLYVGAALEPVDDDDGIGASDHASFWSRGYPGILAIEDDVADFSPWYHTTNDSVSTLDVPYATAFARAALATAAHLAEPEARGALFFPLVPCRLVDTRDAAFPAGLGPPALAASSSRAFVLSGRCGVPADATALAVNVTSTGAAAAGTLSLFPGRGTPPAAAGLPVVPGRTRATATVLPVGPGGVFTAGNGAPGEVHLVLDVVGAFR